MNFAMHGLLTIGPATTVVTCLVFLHSLFALLFALLKLSYLFSTRSELFARFYSARPLFSTICGLFWPKHRGWGTPRLLRYRLYRSRGHRHRANGSASEFPMTDSAHNDMTPRCSNNGRDSDRQRVVPPFQLHMRYALLFSTTSSHAIPLK